MTFTQDILDLVDKRPEGLEEPERLALLQAAEKLTVALENPVEKFFRLFTALYIPVVIRLAIDLNLVDIALAHGSPISSAELASQSNADPALMTHILRLLVYLSVFAITPSSPPTYTVLPFGYTLTAYSPLRSAMLHLSQSFPMTTSLPAFFEANGHQDLQDARYALFSFAPENERMANAFDATMALQKQGDEETFVSSYPVSEKLSIDDAERVLFVDVGSGVGHQLLKFQARTEGLKGKMVLHDLPGVIAQADSLPENIVKVGHDFFQPLPEAVRGAKAFYLRNILHDWTQTQASVILKNIADAMAEDSVVLIHEILLPETGVSYFDAMMDWHMMNIGALERTEEQWKTLVGSVGLKIKGVCVEGGTRIEGIEGVDGMWTEELIADIREVFSKARL